ncbi:MAG TPA: rhodanese-like domain-containing protein [Bryobacteraceae bacterium]|nr:rhodanese-like domain-containing protein [Bryobacteraceae bacterium]
MPQPAETLPLEVSAQDVQSRLSGGENVSLIDVREPAEHAAARIEGAELIPMRTVPGALTSLEARAQDHTLIVFCHHGVRSLNVVHWLRQHGVESCQSMAGGIDAWSLHVDPAVPRYQ